MNSIAVSIVVPIFNKEKYLDECLNTLINQTLKSIEIILVDDGSTDSSKQLCEKYLKDERVSYFYQENEGLASARQSGMDIAHGEYIGFVDADDWVDLDMFEKMYQTAKDYDADVVYCNLLFDNVDHIPSTDIPSGYFDRARILEEVLPKSMAYIDEKGRKRFISWTNCRRIFRRRLLEEIGFRFDKRFRRSQDLQLTYEFMLSAKSFYHMGEDCFYHVRQVADSLSRGYTKNMWSLYVPLIERLYADTEAFHEIDLMPQMHLRAFFFALECMENELKPAFPYDEKTRLEKITEIVSHPICERYYGHIPIEKMEESYQKYYVLFHRKDAKGIVKYHKKLENQRKRKANIYAPIADFITEGPIIGAVYKKIRKK